MKVSQFQRQSTSARIGSMDHMRGTNNKQKIKLREAASTITGDEPPMNRNDPYKIDARKPAPRKRRATPKQKKISKLKSLNLELSKAKGDGKRLDNQLIETEAFEAKHPEHVGTTPAKRVLNDYKHTISWKDLDGRINGLTPSKYRRQYTPPSKKD
jgi:hypothetical protein